MWQKICLPFFILIILLSCQTDQPGSEKTVTFRVIPETLPDDGEIFITGDHPQLGGWDPNEVPMSKQPDGSWNKALTFDAGTHLEYKFTRGSWPTEAVNFQGIEYPNFTLQVTQDTTITFEIPNWRDTFEGKTVISLQRLKNKAGNLELIENWKYHPGDNPAWADPLLNDRDWQSASTRLSAEEQKKMNWEGIGWFRLHLTVDSSLWQEPLALIIDQAGASEIYLNGERVYQFGEVGTTPSKEKAFLDQNPKAIKFAAKSHQVLAIRYSNFTTNYIADYGGNTGFYALLGDLNSFIEGRAARVRNYSNYQMIFTSIPITLAVLHMLLFAFFPGYRENFFYSICMVGFAALSFSNFQIPFSTNVDEIVLHNKIVFSAINIAFLFGLLTAYIRGYQKLPGHSLIFILISTIFVIWMWVSFNPALFNYFYIYLGIAGLELLRVLFRPNFRTKKGEWIFGIGFIGLLLAVAYQVLIEMDILESIGGNDIVYVYGILILSVAVSINLARDFAKTHEQLIEREREAREHEIERRMLEAENERKTRELEEARNLQLSMLPKTIPKISNLDIAVYMKTATEVGGDYYDFNITGDGSLTVAIGDATGHGTKAGIMVTLIKSLFNTMGNTFYLPDFFQHCTRMIKRMHLGNLYMAMMLVRIRDHQLTASAAGMPPLLIYRKDTKQVEEMEIKGLPLGGVERFSYREVKNSLNPGDTILLMSDGFPELFNENQEMLDYSRARKILAEVGDKAPQEIIDHFTRIAEQWLNGSPQNDDMTFVVLKVTG